MLSSPLNRVVRESTIFVSGGSSHKEGYQRWNFLAVCLALEQETFQELSLRAKDRDLLYFKLPTFIDDIESVEGIIISAVNRPDNFSAVEQYHHFAVIASVPLDCVSVPVFQCYSPVTCFNDPR